MRKSVFDRVLRDGSVDTRKYRYRLGECNGFAVIMRIELSLLDTDLAYDGWQVVQFPQTFLEV